MSEIDLFGEESDVVLPKIENEEEIGKLDVAEALSGDMVQSVLLPTEEDVILPNYVIDLSVIEEVDPIQIGVLDSLIMQDGDVAVYILIQGSVQRIGMGYKETLDRIIAMAIESSFGKECKVYKDYKAGEKPIVYGSKDITKLKLNI